MQDKQFFLLINAGFGNKIYRVIIGLYIKQKNNATFNSYIMKSDHESDDDMKLTDIFPKLNDYINLFNNWKSVDTKFPIIDRENIICDNFPNFKLETNKITFVNKTISCFKFVFDIYHKLDIKYKEALQIDNILIDKKIDKLTNSNYIIIHIRYGDKLDISYNRHNNKRDDKYGYLIYTPEYYIKMIKYLQKKNMKIYIISDDNILVNKYIMNKVKNLNVELLDLPFFESFYLLTKASYIVLSISTFSFLGMLINLKLKKAYYLERPTEINDYIMPEEKTLNDKRIIKFTNKKYILNYNGKLMGEMKKARKKN